MFAFFGGLYIYFVGGSVLILLLVPSPLFGFDCELWIVSFVVYSAMQPLRLNMTFLGGKERSPMTHATCPVLSCGGSVGRGS